MRLETSEAYIRGEVSVYLPVRPDWAINCTLGNFSKPLATIDLLKSPTFLGNFIIFLVKSFLDNFYRHITIFLVTLVPTYIGII